MIEPLSAPAAPAPRPRLLVVEDDAEQATLVAIVAQRCGFTTKVVHGIRAAVEALHRERFDVVLLDFTLSDSSGMDSVNPVFWAAVEATPVISISETTDEELEFAAIRRGVAAVCAKRFIMEDLRRDETALDLRPRNLWRAIQKAVHRVAGEQERLVKKLDDQAARHEEERRQWQTGKTG